MTECTQSHFDFPACKSRKVQADFNGGTITSDGGALLLRQADRRVGLSKALARALPEARRRKSCEHSLPQLLRQRIYGIALGYEDLNDHQHLRHDPGLQTCAESDRQLAGASTLCRWENRADRQAAWVVHEWLVERFIDSIRRSTRGRSWLCWSSGFAGRGLRSTSSSGLTAGSVVGRCCDGVTGTMWAISLVWRRMRGSTGWGCP